MDTGEFLAINVVEDELRAQANINHRRAEELATAFETHARRMHTTYHVFPEDWRTCIMSTCMFAKRVLDKD